jgi:protein TonB
MTSMMGARSEPVPVAAPRPRDPADDLFAEALVTSRRKPLGRWKGIVPFSVASHALVLLAIIFVPIFVPSDMPDQKDYIRALLYDPPPPPPPPLPRGSSLKPEQAKPDTPKPVTENKQKPEFQAPIETPQPTQTAKIEPEQGVRPEDQFGSETGSELGDPLGMEGGIEGGVVGGVPGGVLGGVLGGTGTGPVMDYDSAPRPIKITRPQYPQEAFIKKIEGTVIVEILIDSAGRVVRARVIQSVPMLDAAALQTVYQWVFQPAVKHGRPVPTIAHAPVAFRIY